MDDKNLTERGTENSLRGKIKHAAGHLKDAVGGLTGDKSLQVEGKVDQFTGKAQDTIGEVQRDLDRPADRDRI